MQYFHDLLRIFAALEVFFNIFHLKWGIKWRWLWNSSQKFEFSVFNLKWFIFVLYGNGHFLNVLSTLASVVKLDLENGKVVSTLPNVFHTKVDIHDVDLTLFDVVSLNVDTYNVVSTLTWPFPTSQRIPTYQPKDNVETTLKCLLGWKPVRAINSKGSTLWLLYCFLQALFWWYLQ